MNPYLVLGVPREADDARVRQAYLAAIREATPETNPERFKALTVAYDRIKDETSRSRYELFNLEPPGQSPLETALRHWRLGPPPAPMPFETLKDYLRACSKI